MVAIMLIIQSTLLLYLVNNVEGNKIIYFCQSKTVALKCDIDFNQVRKLYWYDRKLQHDPVASFRVRGRKPWSLDNKRYQPDGYELTVHNATDGDVISCENHYSKRFQNFLLQQFRGPSYFSPEILNCPSSAVEKEGIVNLTCRANGYYPNGSVYISWSSTGDICLKGNERIDEDIIIDTFNLTSSVVSKVSENQTVTCRLEEPTVCARMLTSTFAI